MILLQPIGNFVKQKNHRKTYCTSYFKPSRQDDETGQVLASLIIFTDIIIALTKRREKLKVRLERVNIEVASRFIVMRSYPSLASRKSK